MDCKNHKIIIKKILKNRINENTYFMLLIFLIVLVQFELSGKYAYNASHFSEDIELKENNKFIYNVKFNFSQYQVSGNYHILNDSLILNSSPQKDRILVFEFKRGTMQNSTFEVKSKSGAYFSYSIHIILRNGEEIEIKDQWEKSKFKDLKIREFYIVDKNGLKSPTYIIKGTMTNYFEILFETSRVFENESWVIKDGKIIPRNFQGQLQEYYLKKR